MALIGALAIVVFVFVCYWPITRYFFAQDDFVFLENASKGIGESLKTHFSTRPGQFRPLTKGLYFLGMWPVFGMHPVPYHLMSMVMHAINSLLAGVVLRRMGISTVVSWAMALVFAAHLGHFEALGWISCVQQLLGGLLLFLVLIFGLDALAGKGGTLWATIAYGLALASYEQALAAPFVLLAWQWTRHGFRAAMRAAGRQVLPMLILLAIYLAYAFGLRGMPETGPYVMSVGKNVIENLRQYTGIAFQFWLIYPVTGLPKGFTVSHAAWIALVVFHIFRGTSRDLIFGVIFFLALLAPVLFTSKHTHTFHLYLPALGCLFILASAIESIRRMVPAVSARRFNANVAVLALLVAGGSLVAAHINFHRLVSLSTPLPRSFVLRRAVLANRVCTDVAARWKGGNKLFLVYGATAKPNWVNVQSAISKGSALRLVLKQPDLEVVWVPPAPKPAADGSEGTILIVSALGDCLTPAEWVEGARKDITPPSKDEEEGQQ